MGAAFVFSLLVAGLGWSQGRSEPCCKCGAHISSDRSSSPVCLSAKEMRDHVDHMERLQPSGLGKGLNLSGAVVVEIRFGSDGKVVCSRFRSGHPIAIAAATEALPKWTFKPLVSNGVAKAACGRITIKYRLRDQDSSTELQ
jgi:hypothetical protein